MSKIIWDDTGKKFYETGCDRGVLYVSDGEGGYKSGVAWNGLTSVTENPSGAESTALYADNVKYLNMLSSEDFGATIEAYTYPDEFMECDGSASVANGVVIGQQARTTFAMCYRTLKGNDVAGTSLGYKIHIIFNATASPSSKAYSTVNESPEAMTFSWEVSTTPVPVEGFKPTASIVIDSTKVEKNKLTQLETKLYGGDSAEPTMPTITEIINIFKQGS